ncbi:MAG: GNAT family N-acetyltransferase [Lachnospiraceae bacterium]|nr:GNAT family N-acetyltransferase [Lachnospiraceae bacterium]
MNYKIVEGADKFRVEDVEQLLKMTYWADKRPVETIVKSMQNSACFGVVVESGELVGFARVISDYATSYYLCDVVVDEKYRGVGLGTALVSHIASSPEFSELRGILITKDAHGLYAKFGFKVLNDRVMVKAAGGAQGDCCLKSMGMCCGE